MAPRGASKGPKRSGQPGPAKDPKERARAADLQQISAAQKDAVISSCTHCREIRGYCDGSATRSCSRCSLDGVRCDFNVAIEQMRKQPDEDNASLLGANVSTRSTATGRNETYSNSAVQPTATTSYSQTQQISSGHYPRLPQQGATSNPGSTGNPRSEPYVQPSYNVPRVYDYSVAYSSYRGPVAQGYQVSTSSYGTSAQRPPRKQADEEEESEDEESTDDDDDDDDDEAPYTAQMRSPRPSGQHRESAISHQSVSRTTPSYKGEQAYAQQTARSASTHMNVPTLSQDSKLQKATPADREASRKGPAVANSEIVGSNSSEKQPPFGPTISRSAYHPPAMPDNTNTHISPNQGSRILCEICGNSLKDSWLRRKKREESFNAEGKELCQSCHDILKSTAERSRSPIIKQPTGFALESSTTAETRTETAPRNNRKAIESETTTVPLATQAQLADDAVVEEPAWKHQHDRKIFHANDTGSNNVGLEQHVDESMVAKPRAATSTSPSKVSKDGHSEGKEMLSASTTQVSATIQPTDSSTLDSVDSIKNTDIESQKARETDFIDHGSAQADSSVDSESKAEHEIAANTEATLEGPSSDSRTSSPGIEPAEDFECCPDLLRSDASDDSYSSRGGDSSLNHSAGPVNTLAPQVSGAGTCFSTTSGSSGATTSSCYNVGAPSGSPPLKRSRKGDGREDEDDPGKSQKLDEWTIVDQPPAKEMIPCIVLACTGKNPSISIWLRKLASHHKVFVCGRCWVDCSTKEQCKRHLDAAKCKERCVCVQSATELQGPGFGEPHEPDPSTCVKSLKRCQYLYICNLAKAEPRDFEMCQRERAHIGERCRNHNRVQPGPLATVQAIRQRCRELESENELLKEQIRRFEAQMEHKDRLLNDHRLTIMQCQETMELKLKPNDIPRSLSERLKAVNASFPASNVQKICTPTVLGLDLAGFAGIESQATVPCAQPFTGEQDFPAFLGDEFLNDVSFADFDPASDEGNNDFGSFQEL